MDAGGATGTFAPKNWVVAGHEAGHLMGLPDEYIARADLPWILQLPFLPFDVAERLPLPGWENDIMGNPPNGQPSERDIGQIISTRGCKGSP